MRPMNKSTHHSRRPWYMLLAAVLALVMLPGIYYSEAAPLADGQAIFQQKCAGCHTIGGGRSAGPDLKGVTAQRERAWLKAFIATPDKLIAQNDPLAMKLLQEYNNIPMPSLGLSASDVEALVEYIEAQSGGTPSSASAQTPAQALSVAVKSGDASAGASVFTGARSFEAGGPPCSACHAAAGAGAMGGGLMGPDLTQAYQKYGGETGLPPVLATLPFQSMKPIYDNRPLSPQEQADLTAFLQASASQQPAQATALLAGLAIAGVLGLLAVAQLVWRKRVTSVRKALVDGLK